MLVLVGATNTPWNVDSAIFRRLKYSVFFVGLPDLAARQGLIELNLTEKVPCEDLDLRHLTKTSEGLSGAEIAVICTTARRAAECASIKNDRKMPVTMGQALPAMKTQPRSASSKMLAKFTKWKQFNKW